MTAASVALLSGSAQVGFPHRSRTHSYFFGCGVCSPLASPSKVQVSCNACVHCHGIITFPDPASLIVSLRSFALLENSVVLNAFCKSMLPHLFLARLVPPKQSFYVGMVHPVLTVIKQIKAFDIPSTSRRITAIEQIKVFDIPCTSWRIIDSVQLSWLISCH